MIHDVCIVTLTCNSEQRGRKLIIFTVVLSKMCCIRCPIVFADVTRKPQIYLSVFAKSTHTVWFELLPVHEHYTIYIVTWSTDFQAFRCTNGHCYIALHEASALHTHTHSIILTLCDCNLLIV